MGYTVSSTSAPTITSSDGDVAATITGSVLGLSRVGIGQQAAVGDTVRLFGAIGWESTLEGPVTLTIPLPYKASAAPLSVLYNSSKAMTFALNGTGSAIEATFTAAIETGSAYISVEYQAASTNT